MFEDDIEWMAERMAGEGEDFEHLDRNRWMLPVLTDAAIDGEEKVHILYRTEVSRRLSMDEPV